MKRLILSATIALASLIGTVPAQADHSRGLNGLIIGAGGGAIAGQAIGRDTEATLIGTAVGGLLGYVIGSEIDRGYRTPHQVVYHQPQVIHRHQTIVKHYPPPRQVVKHKRVIHDYRHYRPVEERYQAGPPCREAEILGTVNGRAKKLYGTVCRTENGWELVSEPGRKAGRGDHRQDVRYQHWVDRRF